jgi:arginine/ornithine N-succinyltransferase beta subunit
MLLGCADGVRHHERARPFIRDRHERTRREAAAVLGAETFARFYEAGRSTDAGPALEAALDAVRAVELRAG